MADKIGRWWPFLQILVGDVATQAVQQSVRNAKLENERDGCLYYLVKGLIELARFREERWVGAAG